MTYSRHAGTAIPGSFRNDPTALQARASKPQGHSRHVQFSDRAGHGSSRSRLGRGTKVILRRTVFAGVVDEEEFSSVALSANSAENAKNGRPQFFVVPLSPLE